MRQPARIFTLLLLVLSTLGLQCAHAQADTGAIPKKTKPAEHFGHQLRFGLDVARPVANAIQSSRRSYEGAIDYYLRNEVYIVGEGGFGSADYDYPDLSYKSANSFFRVGIDKTLITRLGAGDWDAAFFGFRYGAGFINRQEARYTIFDSVWGNVSGTIPAKSFTAHWVEITGGVRVELIKNVFAGWNVRGRFLLNSRSFLELPPAFIAGYGRGDKTTVFDFNFYLCYALRWGGQKEYKKGLKL